MILYDDYLKGVKDAQNRADKSLKGLQAVVKFSDDYTTYEVIKWTFDGVEITDEEAAAIKENANMNSTLEKMGLEGLI